MDTRIALLETAEMIARKRGLNGFSYADLSAHVGIRKASIHYHFPTKDDLTQNMLDQYIERFLSRLAMISDTTESAAQEVDAYLTAYREALKDGGSVCLCVAMSADRDSLPAGAVESLNAFQKQSEDWLNSVFERALLDRSILAVSSPADEAAAALALVEGAQLVARVTQDVSMFDKATAALRARLSLKRN